MQQLISFETQPMLNHVQFRYFSYDLNTTFQCDLI